MNVVYSGHKHCELVHGPSGSKLETDAPKDNQGRGEKFSPTDLLGASLASCVLTTIAIFAEKENLGSIEGAKAKVTKDMASNPRRVAELAMEIQMPKGIAKESRQRIEEIAEGCPVKRSLNPEIKTPIKFIYPD